MFDKKFLNLNMKSGDYTFLMYYYDLANKLEELLDGADIQDSKTAADLAYYFTKIDEVIKLVKSVKKDMVKKKAVNFLGVALVCGFISLAGNPVLTMAAGCGTVLGGVLVLRKYHDEIKNINTLLKRLNGYSDELQKYSTEISEYEINFAKNKPNSSVSYADMLALIGTLDNNLKKEYLKRLKSVYAQNKDNSWNLALAIKDLKEEISYVEHQNYVDEDFVVDNLLERLENADILDLELVKEIIYYVGSRGVSDKERYYKEFALTCCENIKRRLRDLQDKALDLDVKGFLIKELANLPKDVRILMTENLEELLSDRVEVQNLKKERDEGEINFFVKNEENSLDSEKFLVSLLNIYLQDNYTRKITLPKS